LAKLKDITHTDTPQGLRLAVPNREAWIAVSEEVLYQHQTKLEVRLAETRARINGLEGRLANKSYVDNAPAKIVEETRKELAEQQALLTRLIQELNVL
jgi:valyl-tRNA synthetase